MYHFDWISDIRGLVIIYLIVSGNYLGNLFSCSLQKILHENTTIKMIATFFTILFFVAVEDNKNNLQGSLRNAITIFILFLISTKVSIKYLSVLMILLIFYYLFEKYYEPKGSEFQIDSEFGAREDCVKCKISKVLRTIIVGVMLVGLYVDVQDKKARYGADFSWRKFIACNPNCPPA